MKHLATEMKWLLVILCISCAQACDERGKDDKKVPTQQEVNKGMENINRQFSRDEQVMIEAYIQRRGWEMSETGTGLRYMIYEHGTGDSAVNGQRAVVNYSVSLLDGTEVYSSKQDGSTSFLIGKDNVESGLHEGILLLRIGDRAKFILPSHLAHGLTGDNDKIPPRSTVLYDIELLELR